MNLPTEVFGDVVVVHTPEEIGQEQSVQIHEYLTTLERSKVVVDLDGTESIDSAGLSAILDAQDAIREVRGDIKISTANTVNQNILKITRLDKQLEVFDSVVDAVKSFS